MLFREGAYSIEQLKIMDFYFADSGKRKGFNSRLHPQVQIEVDQRAPLKQQVHQMALKTA